MQHRPDPVAVVVVDGVQHQTFVRIEPDPERPALPAHVVAVDVEARHRRAARSRAASGRRACGPTSSRRYAPRSSGIGTTPRSRTSSTSPAPASKNAMTPSIGRAYPLSVAVVAEVRDAAADAAALLVRRSRTIPRATGRSARGRSRRCRGVGARPASRGAPSRRRWPRTPRRTAAPGACPRATVHERTSPVRDRHDDLDRLEPRPGGTSSASTSRSTGVPGFVREHDRLVGLAQAQVREHRVDLVSGRRRRSSATACADLVGGERVERVRRDRSRQPPGVCCWRMYSADPATKPSTLLAFPVTNVLEVLGDVDLERVAVEGVERGARRARRR